MSKWMNPLSIFMLVAGVCYGIILFYPDSTPMFFSGILSGVGFYLVGVLFYSFEEVKNK